MPKLHKGPVSPFIDPSAGQQALPGNSCEELGPHPDWMIPRSLITPPPTKSFALLPYKKESSKGTKVPFSGVSTHGVSSREPCPISPLFLFILAL